MGDPRVSEAMDAIEEHSESTLQVLAVLDSAEMMRVTRETIVASLEEERRQERARFEALRRTAAAGGTEQHDRAGEPAPQRGAWDQSRASTPRAEGSQEA